MTQHLMKDVPSSKATFHWFITACYFLPLLGGFIADRYWGKYKTIMRLSIPVFTYGIYPLMDRLGFQMTPLRRMSIGMLTAGGSFTVMGMLQTLVDSGARVSVAWQLIPYLAITASEVMVSITGLEFAYTQAPRSMKSTIMSFWLLTVAFGNMLDAVVSQLNTFTGSGEFYFYATLMFGVSLLFVVSAMRYQVREYIENDLAPAGV